MTIQQMRYFMEVIYSGSISEASKRLYIAQSTISAAIQNIEFEFGFPVFVRKSHGVVLTERGESLALDIKRILQQVDMLNAKYVTPMEQRMEFSVVTQHHMPGIDAFCTLIRQHMNSHYRVSFFEMRTTEVLDTISTGKHDVGLLFFSSNSKDFLIQKLRSSNIVFHHIAYKPVHVYLRQGHPLAEQSSISEQDLREFPRVSYDRSIDTDTIFTGALNHHSSRAVNVNDRAAAYAMLWALDGFILGSGYRTRSEQQQGIVALPVVDCAPWEVGYLLQAKAVKSALTGEFLKILEIELEKN